MPRLIVVLAFTPLAFGAVEEWARALGQIGIWLVFAAWILKLIWTPAKPSMTSSKTSACG